jgi:hypothetical protein
MHVHNHETTCNIFPRITIICMLLKHSSYHNKRDWLLASHQKNPISNLGNGMYNSAQQNGNG